MLTEVHFLDIYKKDEESLREILKSLGLEITGVDGHWRLISKKGKDAAIAFSDIDLPFVLMDTDENIVNKSGDPAGAKKFIMKCLSSVTESLISEEKVEEYKGYIIYRVSDSAKDDFEIWKNGRKVISCETSKAAEEWIDDRDSEMTEALEKILNGVPVREALFNFKSLGKKVADAGEKISAAGLDIKSLCKSLSANDIYSCTSKFKSLIGEFVKRFNDIGDVEVDLEFAVDKSDRDSSGASISLTKMPNGTDAIEVSKLKDGVMSTVKKTYQEKYQEVLDVFKKLVSNAESVESDENKIVMSISFDGNNYDYEMDNPSFKAKTVAAMEAAELTDLQNKLK